MSIMTSLEAQNQFGRLIDSSQREPVTITRHGRPVAVMLSYDEYASTPVRPRHSPLLSHV